MEKQQARGIELDVPGLRAVTQGSPEFFGDVGLQVRSVSRVGLRVQPEVKRHLVRGFAGGRKPTAKDVFAGGAITKHNLVRAVSEMR